jgi:hypothetical protein
MKHFTLLLALFAFLAVGCTEETEIETPTGEIEYEEETTLDDEMDAIGNEIEEGAQDVEEGAQDVLTDEDGNILTGADGDTLIIE